MTRRRLLLVGVLAYLVFLVARLPAGLAYRWMANSSSVRAYGIAGSVWSGSATAVVRGRSRFEHLTWRMLPGQLLLGRVAFHVTTRSGASSANADLGVGIHGLAVRDLRARADAATLQQWLGTPALPVTPMGTLRADLSSVDISGDRLRSASGTLHLEHLAVRLDHRISLGNLVIRLAPSRGGVHGSFTGEGAFQGTGELTLATSGNLSLNANFKLSPSADPQLEQMLHAAGVGNPHEKMRLQVNGNVFRGNIRPLLSSG